MSLFLVSDFTETETSAYIVSIAVCLCSLYQTSVKQTSAYIRYSLCFSASLFLVSDLTETETSAYIQYSLCFSASLFLVSDFTETETSAHI